MGNVDIAYLFTSAESRISRQQWWIGAGILFAIWLFSAVLLGRDGLIPFIIGILIGLAGIMLYIKRCHDRDKPGWWFLLLLVPFVNFI